MKGSIPPFPHSIVGYTPPLHAAILASCLSFPDKENESFGGFLNVLFPRRAWRGIGVILLEESSVKAAHPGHLGGRGLLPLVPGVPGLARPLQGRRRGSFPHSCVLVGEILVRDWHEGDVEPQETWKGGIEGRGGHPGVLGLPKIPGSGLTVVLGLGDGLGQALVLLHADP